MVLIPTPVGDPRLHGTHDDTVPNFRALRFACLIRLARGCTLLIGTFAGIRAGRRRWGRGTWGTAGRRARRHSRGSGGRGYLGGALRTLGITADAEQAADR